MFYLINVLLNVATVWMAGIPQDLLVVPSL